MGDLPTLLCQLEEEVCACGVCRYLSQPRVLPCLHSFCGECLERHIDNELHQNTRGKSYFPCPTCKQPTEVPKTAELVGRYADCFNDDTFVDQLRDVIEAYSSTDKSCDPCHRRGDPCTALSWCVDCCQAVCDTCTSAHLHDSASCEHMVGLLLTVSVSC